MKQIENITLQLGEAERTLAEKEDDMESQDKTSKNEVHFDSESGLSVTNNTF